MSLKDKKILITAGPTWTAIDSVRVISNIASGETGFLLADKFNRLGAKVTLLLGPVGNCSLNKRIRLVRFCFFEELKSKLEQELRKRRYDVFIQAAAVSDYRPRIRRRNKIKSGIKRLRLELEPTPKIINCAKIISPSLFTVGFKFEPQADKEKIIKEARALMRAAKLDLVVANTVTKKDYRAHIVMPQKIYGSFSSKPAMGEALVRLIGSQLCRN